MVISRRGVCSHSVARLAVWPGWWRVRGYLYRL
jgi:hypothetical protein